MKRFTLPILVIGSLLFLTSLPQALAGYFEVDKTRRADGSVDGSVVHKAVCASCHGYEGAGDYPSFVNEQLTPRLSGRGPGMVLRVGRGGREPSMPGFSEAELSDGELADMGQYSDVILPSTGPAPDICKPGSPAIPSRNTSPNPLCTATITILDEDPWFQPYTLALPTLPATVAFLNIGQTWHTVTQGDFLLNAVDCPGSLDQWTSASCVGKLAKQKSMWNSGLIGRGGRTFHTYASSGTGGSDVTIVPAGGQRYQYYCMLHPFMQIEICAGMSTCAAPAPGNPNSTKGLPTTAGVGELWVAVQFADVPGKPTDQGNTVKAPFPDLDVTFDDKVKDGELQVIDLTNYQIRRVPGTASANHFSNPHYIWARPTQNLNNVVTSICRTTDGFIKNPEMVINNYLDNYLTMVDACNFTTTVPELVWGTTTSHTTGKYNGSMLYAPVQGDWAIQQLDPNTSKNTVGVWKRGNLLRFDSRDQYGRIGSMPHGIWAGGTDGSLIQTSNSRSNNITVYDIPRNKYTTCTVTTEGFPLNSGITGGDPIQGVHAANTNIGNPFTPTTSISVNVVRVINPGTSKEALICAETARKDVQLPGEGAVQTPPSPDNRFWAISNGPYISFVDRFAGNFPAGSLCNGGTAFRTTNTGGFRVCDINVGSFGAHGVAWGRKLGDATPGATGWRVYMAGKFVNFVAVLDVQFLSSDTVQGPVSISYVGSVPLLKYTTGKVARAGYTDTGGQGITTNPLPPPWK